MHYIYNYISVFYKNATENILKCVFKHFLLHLENWESWAYLFFHYSFSKTKGSDLKVSSEFQRLNTTSSNNSTIFKPPSVGPLLLFLCKNIPIGAVYEDIRSWRQSCGVFRWGKGTQLLASVFSQWWNFWYFSKAMSFQLPRPVQLPYINWTWEVSTSMWPVSCVGAWYSALFLSLYFFDNLPFGSASSKCKKPLILKAEFTTNNHLGILLLSNEQHFSLQKYC